MTGTGMVVGGTVLMAIVAAVLVQMAKQKKDGENVIEKCFGRPMITNIFTLDEAQEWIAKREGNLNSDVKALITTLSQKNLAKFGIEFPVKENAVIKNYLLLAMINTKQGKIVESALVKYENLDQNLKAALDKGDGSMVVKV